MTARGRADAGARSPRPSPGSSSRREVAASTAERKRRGDYPTPHWLVDETVAGVLPALQTAADPVRVLDPACGDGRFLVAAARWLCAVGRRVVVHGCDIEPAAIAGARRRLADELGSMATMGELSVGDALVRDWSTEFDVIVGNPPYLSQLSARTSRGAASARGGGPYADVAAEFVALAAELVAPGGVIGLVLPQSLLASRDVAEIRSEVDRRCERIWSWWSPRQVFDANVVVCALGLRRRMDAVEPEPPAPWTEVITNALGVPRRPRLAADGVLGDRLHASVEFRGVFYALAAAVVDDAEPAAGPPLVTTGMIDPWSLGWGARDALVNKRRFRHPRVALDRLDEAMRTWADAQLVPKLLVANQSRAVEAVVDAAGGLLPSVPVLTLRPLRDRPLRVGLRRVELAADELLWQAAAVLSSPVATIVSWHRQAGTGMSGRAIRLTPASLAAIPWPSGDLTGAAARARVGDHDGAVRAVLAAYGLPEAAADELSTWQASWSARGAFRSAGGQTEAL